MERSSFAVRESPGRAANAATSSTPIPYISGLQGGGRPQVQATDSEVKRAFIASRTINLQQQRAQEPQGQRTFGQRMSAFFRQCCGCGCGCFSSSASPNRDQVPPSKITLLGRRVLYTKLWKRTTFLFTMILLFMPPFQSMFSGFAAYLAFDIVYIISLVYFIADMTLRVFAEPGYMKVKSCGKATNVPPTNINHVNSTRDLGISDRADDATVKDPRCCHRFAFISIGSFLFWCDMISTLTLLFNISDIGPRSETKIMDLMLNASGQPFGGMGDYRRLRPVRVEIDLLVTIARTARIARFIQSRRAMELSSKVNWYWIVSTLSKLNPFPYFHAYWERREQRRISMLAMKYGTSEREAMPEPASGTMVRSSVVEPSSILQSGPISGAIEETPEGQPRTQLLEKRASWGFIHTGALATIRAQQEAERLAKAEAQVNSEKGFLSSLKKSLDLFGIFGDDKEAIRRHIAAMKIQRVFRAHMKEVLSDGPEESAEFENNAWGGRNTSNNLEKVLHKRSMMRQHAHLNNGTQTRHGLNLDMLRSSRGATDVDEEVVEVSEPGGSRFRSAGGDGRESQVGCDMRELTGQRVAIGILLALVATVVFTHQEMDTTRANAMIVLHRQTSNARYGERALDAARGTSIKDLFRYEFANGTVKDFNVNENGPTKNEITGQHVLRLSVTDTNEKQTVGYFALRDEKIQSGITEFVATIFILVAWFIGVTAFSGPVMTLVVIPIERMVRLLGMLMLDPLGYQDKLEFAKFKKEEDALVKDTKWTKELLRGMETSFLMSTILRIGSLMRVGFGSAGAEIIRNNLQKGNSNGVLTLTNRGSTVSCIFLFCDVRSFTDATECLQEEVFVFTNLIAAVVHSKVHSYGGNANKNIGDAFLVSWLLEDSVDAKGSKYGASSDNAELVAKHHQADKALLSVVKICIDLQHDKYFTESLSENAHKRLRDKLKNRPGPVVQMGFGLHAGKAVQGAIGSQRKIDATYVSESVERSEFLESSTKAYGLKMLMSNCFHRLLHPSNRKKCRKVDQILFRDNEEDVDSDDFGGSAAMRGDIMELFTYDMDIDALWRKPNKRDVADSMSESGSVSERKLKSTRAVQSKRNMRRRRSITIRSSTIHAAGLNEEIHSSRSVSNHLNEGANGAGSPAVTASMSSMHSERMDDSPTNSIPDLVLHHGPIRYTHGAWQTPSMKKIRERYLQGKFFLTFNTGLQAFYDKDWDRAKQCFQTILDRFEDGPSLYFMKQIKENNGTPPNNFLGYGLA